MTIESAGVGLKKKKKKKVSLIALPTGVGQEAGGHEVFRLQEV